MITDELTELKEEETLVADQLEVEPDVDAVSLGESEEQPEELEEEEELDEEADAEREAAIADYTAKLVVIDEQIAELRANELERMKTDAMTVRNYTADQVERYVSHIEGTTPEEVTASINRLQEEIPSGGYLGADASPMNGVKQMKKVDVFERGRQYGRDVVKRLYKERKIR